MINFLTVVAVAVALVLIAGFVLIFRGNRYRQLIWSGQMFLLVSVVQVFEGEITGWLSVFARDDVIGAWPMAVGIVWWLSLAWLAVRALDASLWQGLLVVGERPRVPKLLTDLSAGLIYIAAIIAIVYFVFEQSVTGLLATSGVVAVVLGFALQNTLGDFFSGIALNMEGAYHEGEWIALDGGVEGKVVEINWRATRLRMRDDNTLLVPNNVVARARVTNFSYPDTHYAIFFHIPVDYSYPPNRVKAVMLKATLAADKVLRDPPPRVTLDGFGEWGAVYQVKYWVDDYGRHPFNRDAVSTLVVYHLHRAGIPVAVPRREISVGERPKLTLPSAADAERLLARVEVFEALTSDERGVLAQSMHPELFANGEPLVRQGEPGASLFIIADGEAAVTVRTRRGREREVARLGAGQYFGELSLLTGAERSATVVARGDVLVYEIEKGDIEPLLTASRRIAEDMSRVLAERQATTAKAGVDEPDVSEREVHGHAEEIIGRIRAFFGIGHRQG